MRIVVAVVTSLVATLAAQSPSVWPERAWRTASVASQGFEPAAFDQLDADVRAGTYGHIDHLFVARRGYAVIDKRYARDYQAISRGRSGPIGCGAGCADPAAMHEYNYYHPNWHPYHQGRDVHSLQSVTKSIAATVVGIAQGRGRIKSLDVPFLTFFADRDLSRIDARLKRATLQDLLTMRSGIEWHENDRPMDDTNTTLQLEKSRDWIQFTLDQPMDADPGTKWVYNSGGSQLLSGVVRSATGTHIDTFASDTLFRPIGIREFHWKKTPTGHPDTEGGLYLAAADLARIGHLYLHDGIWNGRRVLPEGWVRDATARHVTGLRGGWDYGYQWWITSRNGVDIWAGRGFGGQFLVIIPSRHIVGVVFAWNVFGGGGKPIFEPFVSALLRSS